MALNNSSGALQTFNNRVYFSTGSQISASADSTVTFASTVSKYGGDGGGNLFVVGGGTVNFTGAFSSYTTFQDLYVRAGSTVNYDTASANGFNNYIAETGRINILRPTADSGIALQLAGNGSQIYLMSAISEGAATLNFWGTTTPYGSPASNLTQTFGADIAGTGTASYTGNVRFNVSAAGTNQTWRLSAAAGNTLIFTGTMLDAVAPGTGTKVEVVGPGTVRFAGTGANTFTDHLLVSSGTLELAKTAGVNAVASSSVTIATAGALILKASNQIADTTALTFDGGTFDVGAFSESLGSLTVGANGGTIDFDGLAGSLTFDSLSSITGTLTINGWSEGVASIFFTDGSGWDAVALAKVNFVGYSGAAFDVGSGELYAIPEPSSVALFMLGAFTALCLRRRRA